MIWLRNTQEAKLKEYDFMDFLEFMHYNMTSFQDYFNSINTCNIDDNRDDILFHLNQIVDIYIHSRIVFLWLHHKTIENRINFFNLLLDSENIKTSCSITNILSSTRIQEIDPKILELLETDIDEFCKINANNFLVFTQNFLEKDMTSEQIYNAYNFYINLYIYDYFWMCLKVFPDPNNIKYLGALDTSEGQIGVPNFTGSEIYSITENFTVIEKINFMQKLDDIFIESLGDYIKLSKLLENKKYKETTLCQTSFTTINNNSFHTITNNYSYNYSDLNNQNITSSINVQDGFDEMQKCLYEKLCKNHGYITLLSILKEADVYFRAFIKLGYMRIEKEIIKFNAPFSNKAFAEFVKDEDFLFFDIKGSIPDAVYKDLFHKTFHDLEQRESSSSKYPDVKKGLISCGVPKRKK